LKSSPHHRASTTRFEFFSVPKIHPEDGGSMVHRNFGILPQYFTTSQP